MLVVVVVAAVDDDELGGGFMIKCIYIYVYIYQVPFDRLCVCCGLWPSFERRMSHISMFSIP